MGSVEEAVKKINAASEALGELIQANEVKAVELDELGGRIDKEIEAIGIKKSGLDTREKAIKNIEDVAKVKKDTENLLKSVEHTKTDIAKRQKKLDGDIVRQKKEGEVLVKAVEHDRIMNKKETDALVKTRHELEVKEREVQDREAKLR